MLRRRVGVRPHGRKDQSVHVFDVLAQIFEQAHDQFPIISFSDLFDGLFILLNFIRGVVERCKHSNFLREGYFYTFERLFAAVYMQVEDRELLKKYPDKTAEERKFITFWRTGYGIKESDIIKWLEEEGLEKFRIDDPQKH